MKTHSQSWWIGKLAVAEEDRFPVSLWEVLVWFCQLTGGPYSHWVPGGNHGCFLHLITIKPHMLLPDWDITEPEQKWTLFPQHLGPIIQDSLTVKGTAGMWMRACWWRTHRPALVQEEEQVHEVDHQEYHIPDHYIQVTPIQSRPRNEETTSWQGHRHKVDLANNMARPWMYSFRRGYPALLSLTSSSV